MRSFKFLVIGLLLWLPLAAQAQLLADVIADSTMTLDGGTAGGAADTMNFALDPSMHRGYPYLLINANAVKASSATDSLTIQYRPARGHTVADTFANAAWKTVYEDRFGSADVAFTDFDWADSAWYWGVLDFDGEAPDWLQVRGAFMGISANDSLALRLKIMDIYK